MIRNFLYQLIKHIRNSFASVILCFCVVKFCNFIYSSLGNNRNFGNIFCFQHGAHCCLIGIQYSINKSLAVHVTAIFCSKYICMIVLSYLDKQRHLRHIQGKVMAFCNSISNWIIVTKFCLVCKNKIRTESIFCTDVRKWENIICH